MVVPGSIPKMIFSNANRVDLTILAKIAKMNATQLHAYINSFLLPAYKSHIKICG